MKTVVAKERQKRQAKLPSEKRSSTLQTIFKESFIKSLDIEPYVYAYKEKEGNKPGGNRGLRAKRSFVHRVFSLFFDTVVNDMVEDNLTFKAPTFPKIIYMYIGLKPEEESFRLFSRKKGLYTSINPIETDFKLYHFYLVSSFEGKRFMYRVKIPLKTYQRLLYKLEQGFRYCDQPVTRRTSINKITTRDYSEEMLSINPGLTHSTYLRIIKEGFMRITELKEYELALLISNKRYGIKYKL